MKTNNYIGWKQKLGKQYGDYRIIYNFGGKFISKRDIIDNWWSNLREIDKCLVHQIYNEKFRMSLSYNMFVNLYRYRIQAYQYIQRCFNKE